MNPKRACMLHIPGWVHRIRKERILFMGLCSLRWCSDAIQEHCVWGPDDISSDWNRSFDVPLDEHPSRDPSMPGHRFRSLGDALKFCRCRGCGRLAARPKLYRSFRITISNTTFYPPKPALKRNYGSYTTYSLHYSSFFWLTSFMVRILYSRFWIYQRKELQWRL